MERTRKLNIKITDTVSSLIDHLFQQIPMISSCEVPGTVLDDKHIMVNKKIP